MPTTPNLELAMTLPPDQAVAYFERLGYAITWDWRATAAATRRQAFAVSKSASLDILSTLHEGLKKATTRGLSEKQFIEEMTAALKAKGWWGTVPVETSPGVIENVRLGSPGRLKTIYRTNLQQAFMSAREAQFLTTTKNRPYWQYLAVMDNRTRPSHAALHKLVYRFDDPAWQLIRPPNGYNCRCRFVSLSAADLKRYALKVESSEGQLFDETVKVGVDKATGEVQQETLKNLRTPKRLVRVATADRKAGRRGEVLQGPPQLDDPPWRWAGAPGASARVVTDTVPEVKRGQALFGPVDRTDPPWETQFKSVAFRPDPGFGLPINIAIDVGNWKKAQVFGDARAEQLLRQIIQQPERQAAHEAWVDQVLADGVIRGRQIGVGYMPAVDRAYSAAQRKPALTGTLVVGDRLLVGAKADRHVAAGDALTADDWKALPLALLNPQAVLWDVANQTLLYVVDLGDAAKVVVSAGYLLKGEAFESVRSAFYPKLADLKGGLIGGKFLLVRGQL